MEVMTAIRAVNIDDDALLGTDCSFPWLNLQTFDLQAVKLSKLGLSMLQTGSAALVFFDVNSCDFRAHPKSAQKYIAEC